MSRPLLEFGGGSGVILRDLLHLRSVSAGRGADLGRGGPRPAAAYQHVPSGAGTPWPLQGRRRRRPRSIIWPPRRRFTWRVTWRVLLMRLSAALVAASARWRRGERPSVSTVTVSSSPSRTLAAAQGCSWSRRRARRQRRKPRPQIERLELQMRGPIRPRAFQRHADVTGGSQVDALLRHRRPQDVPAESFQVVPPVCGQSVHEAITTHGGSPG